jgi:general secretion pathway protein L
VRLTQVTLPPNANRKVLASIGFVLEDDIASEISEHFIALGPKQGNSQSIAVVTHAQMQRWRAWLDDAGFHCDVMVPDVTALPASDSHITALQLGEQLLWRHGQWSGMCGEMSWLPIALQGYINQHPDVTQIDTLTPELSEQLSLSVPVTSDVAQLELPIHVFAKHILPTANLLQQQYKPKRKQNLSLGVWRNAAIVAGLALGLALVDQGLAYRELQQANQRLNAQIQQDIREGFPGLGSYRDPRRAIERYIQTQENNSAGVSGVAMLANLSPAFAAGNITAQTIRFDHKRSEIRMQAVASDFNQLERFKAKATEAGFNVTQGAINNQNNRVIGALIIKG